MIKNIIPAVASTNAVIAAICANEALKLATNMCPPLHGQLGFNVEEGVFAGSQLTERSEGCPVCSDMPTIKSIVLATNATLRELLTVMGSDGKVVSRCAIMNFLMYFATFQCILQPPSHSFLICTHIIMQQSQRSVALGMRTLWMASMAALDVNLDAACSTLGVLSGSMISFTFNNAADVSLASLSHTT